MQFLHWEEAVVPQRLLGLVILLCIGVDAELLKVVVSLCRLCDVGVCTTTMGVASDVK